VEEFEKLASASLQADLFQTAIPDATGVPDTPPDAGPAIQSERRTTIELGEPRAAEVTTADS
jgi:hypothetical protein